MTQDEHDRLLADALRHDPQIYERACQRMNTAPQLLDDDDFEQLRIISPRLATEAHAAQGATLRGNAHPIGAGTKTPPKHNAPPARGAFDETKYLAKHGHRPVSVATLFALLHALADRLARLEGRGKDEG